MYLVLNFVSQFWGSLHLTANQFGRRMTEQEGITRVVEKKKGRTQRIYRGVMLR